MREAGGRRWLVGALVVAAGVLAPAGLVAQDQAAPARSARALCTALPVHTAGLAERLQLADLGAVPVRGGAGLVPAGGVWTPETRLSDAVRSCAAAGASMGPLRTLRVGGGWGGFWAAALPVAVDLRHTTSYPPNMIDGSFRHGVGTMAGVVGGFAAGMGPLTVVVRPEFHHHENADFDMALQTQPGHSPYIHPSVGTRIDLPQRFGDESFQVLSPGQTTLRLDVGPVAAGVSTENAVWGPGIRNPLILSSAGPGLPHVFLGTSRPVDIRIGQLFVRTLVARTTESDYFDTNPDNNHLLLSGVIGSFEPAPLPGLTLGATRFYALRESPEVGVGTLLQQAFTGLRENPLGAGNPLADNQHASVFARWAFPDAGLAVYGEFARIDHWWEWIELVTTPQAASAWMAGLQKVVTGDASAWRVMVEVASLVDPMPSQLPGRPGNIFWYTHGTLRQGHTHQGQLLGAPIGPGGRQQTLAFDRYADRWDAGLELTRTVYNDDSYNRNWWRYFHTFGHDAELSALARGRRAIGPVDLHAALGYSHRWNRSFLGLAELVGTAWDLDDIRRDSQWYLELRGSVFTQRRRGAERGGETSSG